MRIAIISHYIIGTVLFFTPLHICGQSRLVSLNLTTPSLAKEQVSLKVYLPPNYDESNNDQYRLVIFLHGSGRSTANRIASVVQPALDEMIQRAIDFPSSIRSNDFKVRPMIVVFPSLKATFSDKPTFSSAHQYENSEYFGNYEDVIVKDLIQSLQQEDEYNLKNKIAFNRESMGIAGFSSGGDGALRIGLKHRDLFIAIGAHAAYASLRPQDAWDAILEQFRVGTKLFVDELNGLSAVWVGLDSEGKPDLFVNESGNILTYQLDKMRANAGVIQNYFNLDDEQRELNGYLNLADSNDSNLPFIYADCGDQDVWLKGFSEDFIAYMDVVYPDYFRGNIINGLSHELSENNVKRSLDFIDSKMASTTPVYNLTELQTEQFQIKPNPVYGNRIQLDMTLDIPKQIEIHFVNSRGMIFLVPEQLWSIDKKSLEIEVEKYPNGHYTLVLSTEEYQLSKKFILMH